MGRLKSDQGQLFYELRLGDQRTNAVNAHDALAEPRDDWS